MVISAIAKNVIITAIINGKNMLFLVIHTNKFIGVQIVLKTLCHRSI